MKKKLTSPTSNFKVLGITAHVTTIIISVFFVLTISYTFGFGLSVNPIIKDS